MTSRGTVKTVPNAWFWHALRASTVRRWRTESHGVVHAFFTILTNRTSTTSEINASAADAAKVCR